VSAAIFVLGLRVRGFDSLPVASPMASSITNGPLLCSGVGGKAMIFAVLIPF
jgi:hypothetical protein